MLLTFRERGREREVTKRDISMRETSIRCLWFTPWLGTEPATQVSVLTRDQTHNLSVYGMMLQPTEPHCPGQERVLFPSSSYIVLFFERRLKYLKTHQGMREIFRSVKRNWLEKLNQSYHVFITEHL